LLDLPIRLIQDGSLIVADLMTHTISPSDCAAAYDMAFQRKDTCLGIAFDWRLV
jgi:threonine dehydrogenase-like Zn-dependent dehydrogenase